MNHSSRVKIPRSNIAMENALGLSRCMDPIKNGDIPASYVSLLDLANLL